MKKFVIMLALAMAVEVLGIGGVARGGDEIPYRFTVYGIGDNGERHEQIIGKCIQTDKKNIIQCTFKSTYIRLKNIHFELPPKDEIQKAEHEQDAICKKINSKEMKEEFEHLILSDYEKENMELFNKMCENKMSLYDYGLHIENLEKNQCTVSSISWEAYFIKNTHGNYEHSGISDLFGSGIKKAVLQTIYKDKEVDTRWNFSIEANYMGTPTDGLGVLPPYKDVYSWKKNSPLKLPCKYLSFKDF